MTIFGIDYSGTRPDPKCLAANGVKFAGRYLEPANDWKTLKKPEADRLRAAGVAIVGMFELAPNRVLAGFDAGATDATGVLTHLPDVDLYGDGAVYFAVDFDATPTQLAGPVTAYFQGVASVMSFNQVGAYGGYWTIKYLFDHGQIRWGHQCFAWSGGPDGRVMWDKRAHIQQYKAEQSMCGTNGDIDFNRGMFDNFGQWPASTPPQPGEPMYPNSYPTAMRTMAQIEARETVRKLHPELWRRFKALMEAGLVDGVGVGVGGGWRIQPVNSDGTALPGHAMPGNSNHEGFPADGVTGGAVAIDAVGDLLWMEAHLPVYGLRSFRKSTNPAYKGSDEPWHVQPVEIPASRSYRTTPWELNQFPLPDDPPPPPPPVKEDDMIFLAKLDTNQYLIIQGTGTTAQRVRSVQIPALKDALANGCGPEYHNPTLPDRPVITSLADIPAVNGWDMALLLGLESQESLNAAGTTGAPAAPLYPPQT